MKMVFVLFVAITSAFAQEAPGRCRIYVHESSSWPASAAAAALRQVLALSGFEEVQTDLSAVPPEDQWMTTHAAWDAVISVNSSFVKEKAMWTVTVASIRHRSFLKTRATYSASNASEIPDILERLVGDVAKSLKLPDRGLFDLVKNSVHITPSDKAYELALNGLHWLNAGEADTALTLLQSATQLDGAFQDAWEWKGDALAVLRKQDEAIEAFRKALSLNPKRFDLHHKIGDLLLYEKNDAAAARTEFLKEREARPLATLSLVQIAYSHHIGKDPPSARRDAEKALREWTARYPRRTFAGSSGALNLLGLLAMAERDTARAIQQFQRAREVNPDEASARRNLARIYEIRRDLDHARRLYEEVLIIDPVDAYARLNLANILFYQGRMVDAVPHYMIAILQKPELENPNTNPIQIFHLLAGPKKDVSRMQAVVDSLNDRLLEGNGDARIDFAYRAATGYLMLYYLNDVSGALAQFQLLQMSPYKTSRLYFLTAEAQYRLGQSQSALVNYERYAPYANDSYNYGRCYLQIGKILLQQNKFLDAQLQILKSVRIYPNAESSFFLGLAMRGNQEPQRARMEFERAIRVYPSYTDAYVELARTLVSLERVDSAIIVFRKALSLDSTKTLAAQGLSEAYLKNRDYVAAEDQIRLSMRLPGVDHGKLTGWLGQTFLYRHRYDESYAEFEKERMLDSNAATPYYHLAAWNAAQKKSKPAITLLKQAFEKRFRDFSGLDKDPAFDGLRTDPDYKLLIDQYRQKFQQEVLELLQGNR